MESEIVRNLIEQFKEDGLCTLTEAAAILNRSYSTVVRRKGGTESLTRIRRVLGQRAHVFFSTVLKCYHLKKLEETQTSRSRN